MSLWSIISVFLKDNKLSKYKGIQANDVAKAMIKAAKVQLEKGKIYNWKEMIEIFSITG